MFAPSRPEKSPGLTDYPACDEQVRQVAHEIWGGEPAPAELTERRLGRGRVIWGGPLSPKPTVELDVPPQLGTAKWIWRKEGNPATAVPPGARYFRRVVTLEEDSRIESARLAMTADNSFECWVNGRRVGTGDRFEQVYVMNVAPALKPGPNVVAVAAVNGAEAPNLAGLIGLLTIRLQDGRKLEVATDQSWEAAEKVADDWLSAAAPDGWAAAMELGPCGMVPWVKPAADTLLPPETSEGVTAYTAGRNDVVYPPPGHEVWGEGDAGAGFAVGRNGICVHEHGADHFPAVLVYPTSVTDWTHVAVVHREGTPRLYVNGKLVRTGLKSRFVVHPGVGAPHARPVVSFQGRVADIEQFDRAFGAAEIGGLAKVAPDPAAAGAQPAVGLVRGEIWQPGTYVFQTTDGGHREIKVNDLPAPVEIDGPWEVSFDPRWGGPEKVTFEELEDWSKRPQHGIRYYSGTAVYRKTFRLDPATVVRCVEPV
ncbi:MAG: hypothetical protein A2V70_04145 [Planctomycetes bacterium RBG_13_63_9]|nr:MAG: hypothetical protein A2V70_04145 [Planctomycetes bacterium RBG_13_63_9]